MPPPSFLTLYSLLAVSPHLPPSGLAVPHDSKHVAELSEVEVIQDEAVSVPASPNWDFIPFHNVCQ